MMSQQRNELIDQLASQCTATPAWRGTQKALLWLACGFVLATVFMVLIQPFRPGFEEQLLTVPRFALETLTGLAAVALIGMVAIKMAVPAGNTAVFTGAAIVLTLLWLSHYVVGLYAPALEPSSAGERPFCVWEIFLYGLPIAAAGFAIVSKGYVLNWSRAGLAIGLAAGFIPGLLMQLACMYDAAHILAVHIGPALVLGVAGGLLGLVINRLARSKSSPDQ